VIHFIKEMSDCKEEDVAEGGNIEGRPSTIKLKESLNNISDEF